MSKVILITLLLVFFSMPLSAGEFGPWNDDVSVGDYAPHQCPMPATQLSPRPLYNSFQAGAWFLLRFFQIVISPQDGPNCRFHPTCSRYASQAIQRYGALVGSMLAGDRLIRCNPYNPPGNDPVPETLP